MDRRTRQGRGTGPSTEQLRALMNEVFATFFALREAGKALDAVTPEGGGRWGLLRAIAEEGPVTLVELAQRRSVSRQYVQKIVKPLLEDGLVTSRSNPAHQRSSLLAVSSSGRSHLEALDRRIERALTGLAPQLADRPLADAIETLAAFRASLRALAERAPGPTRRSRRGKPASSRGVS